MGTKLTKAQRETLDAISQNRGAAHRVYALGRKTCEALRMRGLITTSDGERPITTGSNPFVMITDLGREALREASHDH
jgi:hypothetical protein